MKNTYLYQVGVSRIALHISGGKVSEEQFLPFEMEGDADVNVRFTECEEFPDMQGVDLVTESASQFSEYLIDGEYIRTFHGAGTKEPRAILQNTGRNEWECCYLKTQEYHFRTIQGCFRHIALERILMDQEMLILHAAFVRANGEGILFTGQSGIGKSTQAGLWERYEHAEILNGDRTILHRHNGAWYGYGSPYAGSSNIYKRECAKIKAIVVLEQSDENVCVRLSPGKAFAKIYEGTTLNVWNKQFMNQAMDLILGLSIEIPVFHLRCRPEQAAVDELKDTFQKL